MSVKMTMTDNLPQFKRRALSRADMALNEGARDILIGAKESAPFDDGPLRANSDITTPRRHTRWINFYMEYALVQEKGEIKGRRIRNYTTPGTGAHYLENAGKEVSSKMSSIYRKHMRRT